ncbi:MAG: hypothetical protein ACK5ME_11670, partial [Parahaliea sp.]
RQGDLAQQTLAVVVGLLAAIGPGVAVQLVVGVVTVAGFKAELAAARGGVGGGAGGTTQSFNCVCNRPSTNSSSRPYTGTGLAL